MSVSLEGAGTIGFGLHTNPTFAAFQYVTTDVLAASAAAI